MADDPVLRLVDARAGGDVSRVIIDGAPPLAGDSVAAQCADFARRYDHLRLKLIQPPHGALHMCPVLLLPPRSADSDFGLIIMESMGYPPISGSNLFCAVAVALEYGLAVAREPETRLRVETPAGVVAVTADCRKGRCRRVEFENTPARLKGALCVSAASPASVLPVTVVTAGVDYAVVDAARLGVALSAARQEALIEAGIRIVADAGTDFALFYETLDHDRGSARCTIAVFQNPGLICRSPTGTGTSAMLALAYTRGWIQEHHSLAARSPGGGVFHGRILSVESAPSGPLLRTAVAGDVETGPASIVV